MWISKKRYEEILQKLKDSEMDVKYWKESFEEVYEKYLNCLSYKYNNNNYKNVFWELDYDRKKNKQ